MYNIIPLILILISLCVIIVIVLRKFSVLANLNIETIQTEREIKIKEQIISKRLKRNFFRYSSKVTRMLKPLGRGVSSFFDWLYGKLVEFKENYNKESELLGGDTQTMVSKLFSDAEDMLKAEDFNGAENKYIEIIGIDSKNIKAFKNLGCLYTDRKNYNEAKETLEHALRLLEKNYEEEETEGKTREENQEEETGSQIAGIYYDLTEICLELEENTEALGKIKEALKIEPNNPRYLDTMLQISIINKDKASAIDALERLKGVNPENNKLGEFEVQVKEL